MNQETRSVICFTYRLSDADGTVLEQSRPDSPEAYLTGSGGLLPKIEQALDGKQVGERIHLELSADDAYGQRHDDNIQRIAVKHLQPAGGKFRAGDIAHVQTDHGWRQVRVLKLGKFQATVDANHPLAGMDLVFDIDIVAVRPASAEELAHGHAHGADGSAGHH